LLYLYRQAGRNGGHGKYRGGHGLQIGWVGHRTPQQTATLVSQNPRLTTQFGLSGGHWANTGDFFHIEGSSVRAEFASGRIPSTPARLRELDGAARMLAAKEMHVPFGENDVIEHITFGGGGYGDPLERDPELVATDLRAGDVSARAAGAVYGVVFSTDGAVDAAATDRRRDEMRRQRLDAAAMPERSGAQPAGELTAACDIAESLRVSRDARGAAFTCCRHCGEVLCEAERNYKEHSARIDTQLSEIDPEAFGHVEDRVFDLDEPVVYRMYACPSCGTTFENELTVESAPPIWDIAIDVSTIA
jgi:N-methylhydantoinase B